MAGPPGGRFRPPHIRVKSDDEDLIGLVQNSNNPTATPNSRPPTSRSLVQTAPRMSIRDGFTSGSLLTPTTPSTPLTSDPAKERLLGRSGTSNSRYRDDPDSRATSRRNSLDNESVASRDSRFGPFGDATTAYNSRAPSRAGSDDSDKLNTQTVSEKYNILPGEGLLLFPEDVEKDDWLHNPDPNDRKDTRCSDMFSLRGLSNLGGLIFLLGGVLMLFVGYPLLTLLKQETGPSQTALTCASNPLCLSDKLPLLKNIRTGLIDPTTPSSAKTRTGSRGQTQNLVFSDEFNTPGRTFYPGDDPYFQAVDIWYGVTQDLEWYDPDAITTVGGTLHIQFDAFENHDLAYRSGMLQSWNQLCFKGGYMEASISLPGLGNISGFWPGFWSMGNLGRPGYAATTDGMWPYSYDDVCDAGITPNQSDPSGINYLPGMRLPACTCTGQDHPTPGNSRSAPEIDALEAQVSGLNGDTSNEVGFASQSAQIAPFDVWYHPNFEWMEIYDYSLSVLNTYLGGPYQQAISVVSVLNNDWYSGNAYQTYGYEYKPGDASDDAYTTWYVGEPTWTLTAQAIGPNGNIGARVISQEPMAIVANLGMSTSFSGAINVPEIDKLLPANMTIDYIRIYQDEGSELITCDPPGYETTEYIAEHPEAYQNPNVTDWRSAGFSWPLNSLMNGCAANANFNG